MELGKLCFRDALLLSLKMNNMGQVDRLLNAKQTHGMQWSETCQLALSRLDSTSWVGVSALPSKLASSLAKRCIFVDINGDMKRLDFYQNHGAFSLEEATDDAIFWGRKVRSGAMPWLFYQAMRARGMLSDDALAEGHLRQALSICMSAMNREEGLSKGLARRQWRFARQCALATPDIAYEISKGVAAKWIGSHEFSLHWHRRIERFILNKAVAPTIRVNEPQRI